MEEEVGTGWWSVCPVVGVRMWDRAARACHPPNPWPRWWWGKMNVNRQSVACPVLLVENSRIWMGGHGSRRLSPGQWDMRWVRVWFLGVLEVGTAEVSTDTLWAGGTHCHGSGQLQGVWGYEPVLASFFPTHRLHSVHYVYTFPCFVFFPIYLWLSQTF